MGEERYSIEWWERFEGSGRTEEHEGHGDRGRGTGREQVGQLREGACGAKWAKRVAGREREKGRRSGREGTLSIILGDVEKRKVSV